MSPLAIRRLTKRYGAVTAVAGVDLDVARGSRTVIVGPSGSGKTTLLRLIAGFEAPDDGTITLGDTMLAEGPAIMPAHLRLIGYVAQDGALFPHLSVAANIGFGLERNAAGREARVRELMAAVGLPPTMAERRPHALSGGQQQRVALARALARRPGLMLLDEPFSALDTGLREAMREMVGEVLGGAGITTILVTHDQAEALSFADHLAVMRDGRVAQAGPPSELYRRPADPETALFLGEAIILDAAVEDGWADCALGRVAIDGVPRRRETRVMLRPEQVTVLPADGDAPAHGRLVARSYRGATLRLTVELAATPPRRLALTGPATLPLRPGDAVALRVTGEAHAFP